MGIHRHGQEGGGWKCRKVIFVLQMLSKVSVEKLFMHYFEKMLSALGGFAPDPHRGSHHRPRWGLPSFRPHHCPPPEKNPAGAHVYRTPIYLLASSAACQRRIRYHDVVCCNECINTTSIRCRSIPSSTSGNTVQTCVGRLIKKCRPVVLSCHPLGCRPRSLSPSRLSRGRFVAQMTDTRSARCCCHAEQRETFPRCWRQSRCRPPPNLPTGEAHG